MNGMEKCKDCGKLALAGETITISVEEYQKLIRDADAGRANRSISAYRAVSRSGIGLKPELAEFILEKAERMTVKGIHAACTERFGSEAPSRSSIFRFIDKMRKTGRQNAF